MWYMTVEVWYNHGMAAEECRLNGAWADSDPDSQRVTIIIRRMKRCVPLP